MPKPVALIAGAAGGIGSAAAARFAAGGWRVALLDHDGPNLSVLAKNLNGAVVAQEVADVSCVKEAASALESSISAAGRLDCLVNAAGLWTEGPSEETTEEEWDTVVGVNLKGLFFLIAAAIPHLTRTKGSVINLSSDAGIQGNAGAAVYCATKGGVTNLTRALALELAPRGIRVNAICPGDVQTPMLDYQATRFGDGDPDGYVRKLLRSYPQKGRARLIRKEEVAELIWYLAQPLSAPITGANISIDFGLSAGVFFAS